MDIAVIIVGVGEWEKYTLPFIQSIRRHEPAFRIVCVDNGAQYPDCEGVEMVRLPHLVSYAAAINAGLTACKADWYIVSNNDVLFLRPLSGELQALDPRNLYGFYAHKQDGREYLSGWCYLLSDTVRSAVGLFDEAFVPMWFEDADYSYRAQDSGFGMVNMDRDTWGIRHLAYDRSSERLAYMAKHDAAMKHNLEYLRGKHGL